MGSFSIWHWLIVLVIVMLVFGTKKLRNVGSDLGGAVKGFKDGMKDGTADKAGEPPQVSGQTIDAEARREQETGTRMAGAAQMQDVLNGLPRQAGRPGHRVRSHRGHRGGAWRDRDRYAP